MPATKSQIKIDPRYTKTYATEANLNAAIEKAGIADVRHLIVWTESGRVTAVFSAQQN